MNRTPGAALAFGLFVMACGGPDKPPLMPDGPNETMPVGSDGGDLAPPPAAPVASAITPTAPAASAAPPTPAAPLAPAKPVPPAPKLSK